MEAVWCLGRQQTINFLLWKRNDFSLVRFSLVHSHESFLSTTRLQRRMTWSLAQGTNKGFRVCVCVCVCVCVHVCLWWNEQIHMRWDMSYTGKKCRVMRSPGEGYRCFTIGMGPGVGKGQWAWDLHLGGKITLIAVWRTSQSCSKIEGYCSSPRKRWIRMLVQAEKSRWFKNCWEVKTGRLGHPLLSEGEVGVRITPTFLVWVTG